VARVGTVYIQLVVVRMLQYENEDRVPRPAELRRGVTESLDNRLVSPRVSADFCHFLPDFGEVASIRRKVWVVRARVLKNIHDLTVS